MAVFVWNGGGLRNPYEYFQRGYYGNDAVDHQETCEDVIEILLPILEQILSIVIVNNGLARKNALCCRKIDDMEQRFEFLYSAIRDMRRELLRGMVGEVRKMMQETMRNMLPRGGQNGRQR